MGPAPCVRPGAAGDQCGHAGPERSLRRGLGALLLLVALPARAEDPQAHARRLLSSTPLVDGHNDLAWVIRTDGKRDVEGWDLRTRRSDTDLARLREGRVFGQFWSVYVPGKDSHPARTQLEQIDIARRTIARYPDALMLATRAGDVERARKQKKIASFLGMEGGHAIENSLGALRAYYDLGVRYMTLTHNVTLDWADAAMDEPRHRGLTPFGKEVVREMNRLGMLVDLSHVSPDVMRDALDVSAAPVIFSHSNARALTDHPRNVPDEILRRMPKNGGVVMVAFIPSFVSPEAARWSQDLDKLTKGKPDSEEAAIEEEFIRSRPRPRATLTQVADHIEHVRRVAGVDHVGIGADFYGQPPERCVAGLEDVSRYPDLFAELIRRGWSDADLKKLAGENVLRVMRQAEGVAARLQKDRPPSGALLD